MRIEHVHRHCFTPNFLYPGETGDVCAHVELFFIPEEAGSERMAPKSLALSASALVVLGAISKILGFVREQAIASSLGAGYLTDSYVLAFSITGFAFTALNTILQSAFLPVYSSYRARGNTESAALFARTMARVTFGICAVLGLSGSLSAPLLIRFIAPNSPQETAILASRITAVLFPAMTSLSLIALFTAVLHSHGSFALPGLSPIIQNVVIITALFALTRTMSVWGLVTGMVLGMVIATLALVPALKNTPLLSRGSVNLRDESVMAMLRMSGPLFGIAVLAQIYVLVERSLASALLPGSMAALNFALKVVQLPNAVVVMAICAVVFPRFSEMWGKKDFDSLARTSVSTATLVCAIVMPAAIAFGSLATPIVQVVYQRGAFDHAAVSLTAGALRFYSIGILFHALALLFTRAFFGMQDSKTPLGVSFVANGTAVALSFALVRSMAHTGLALANSAGGIVNALLLGWLLFRKIDGKQTEQFFASVGKILLSSVVMAVVAGVALTRFPVTGGNMQSAINFALVALVAGVTYIACIFATKVASAREVVHGISAFIAKLSKPRP